MSIDDIAAECLKRLHESWNGKTPLLFGGPDGPAGNPCLADAVGPNAPTVVNEKGAKQSHVPYRCDLLPAHATLTIAAILHEGAIKYGDENWRQIPFADHINHALTHLFAMQAGDKSDDHIGHATCRLLMALETKLTEGPR